jgi:hypothetical protein
MLDDNRRKGVAAISDFSHRVSLSATALQSQPVYSDKADNRASQPRPLRHVPDSRGRGAPADVPRNPVAHRPVAGAAGASMTGRSGQTRQTTTAEVRLDQGKATSFGPARRATRRFGCKRVVAIEFRCDGASMRRKITRDGPGIRGMSRKRTRRILCARRLLSVFFDGSRGWAHSCQWSARIPEAPDNFSRRGIVGARLLL